MTKLQASFSMKSWIKKNQNQELEEWFLWRGIHGPWIIQNKDFYDLFYFYDFYAEWN